MIEVGELFRGLVSQIDASIKVTRRQVVTGDNAYVIHYTCDTKWARYGKMLYGYNDESEILAVSTDEYIITKGYFEEQTSYSLTPPFAIVGTPMATNIEWTNYSRNLATKTPLIWLLENHTEKVYGAEASLERDINMKVLFLDETDILKYTIEQHRQQVVQPMIKLQEEFIKVIDENTIYKRLKDFNRDTFSRFGKETENGVIKNILDANLSGIIIDISVPKFKDMCKC